MDPSSETLPAPLRVLDLVKFEPKTTEPANVGAVREEMFEQQQAAAVSIPAPTPAPGQMYDTHKSELQAQPEQEGRQKQTKRRNKKRPQKPEAEVTQGKANAHKPHEENSVKPQTSQTHVAREQSSKTQHAPSKAPQEFIPAKNMVWDHIKGRFGQKEAAAFTSVKPKAWSNILIETGP
uniref:Uncharacterized protein n=1 Tax=Knipowitschia caucasica TaxID=637954 RepID=A0AAV2KCU3_KNICA